MKTSGVTNTVERIAEVPVAISVLSFKTRVFFLFFLISKFPPVIISHLSSSDMEVREGDTVTLICNVTGIPHPSVTWYRQSASNDYSTMERIGQQGEVLVIHNVSRYCDDVYECVAKNGIPPSVSRKIKVSVDFAPEVQLRNKRIGQVKGRETILDCRITASPQGVTVWMRDGKELLNSEKYSIEVFNEGGHTITLSLRITQIVESDFGEYTCLASNHLGKDKETMLLYDISEKRRKTTTTTTTQMPRYRPGYDQTRQEQNRNGVSDRQSDKNNVIVTLRNYFNQSRRDPYVPSIILSGTSASGKAIDETSLCVKSIVMYMLGIAISHVISSHAIL